MDEILGDVQTSILGLAGGLFGEVSDILGGKLSAAVGSVGGLTQLEGAVDFIARATVSSVAMVAFHRAMPETSSNQFAQIMFWYADQQTIRSGARLVKYVVHLVLK